MICHKNAISVERYRATNLPWNNRGGATLIASLLVVALILGTITALQFQSFNKEFAEAEIQDADMSLLQEQLDSVLKNEISCRIALGGSTVGYLGAQSGREQPFDPNPLAQNNITLYKADGSVFLSAGTYANNACAVTTPPPNCFGKLQVTRLSISAIQTIATSPFTNPLANSPLSKPVYFAQMVIEAKKSKPTTIGGQAILRNVIKLTVQTNGPGVAKMISCSSLTFFGTDTFPLPICNDGEALYSNGKQIRCVKTICSPGLQPVGYQSSGDVICSP